MAHLYVANLDLDNPEAALKDVYHGLRDIITFLKRSIEGAKGRYLRAAARTMRSRDRRGVWVEIEAVRGASRNDERLLRPFFADGVAWVYDRIEIEARAARVRFPGEHRILVLGRNPEEQRLLLEREPVAGEIYLEPNTYPLECQLKAAYALQNAPHPALRPFIDLLRPSDEVDWPDLEPVALLTEDFRILGPPQPGKQLRDGTEEQRQFVRMALGTRDFAILEGPPGSGKTSAICELLLQAIARGKRVLLCASTHVAVDNVIERLMADEQPHRNEVIPVRIGDQERVSEKARPYQIEKLQETERARLTKWLKSQQPRSEAQEILLESLHQPGVVDRLILDSANVVCGTTIGILQHPDIKADRQARRAAPTPLFDWLVIDEASKTTFQELLVPALLARRWILVGAPRQLSPYVDEEHLAANLDAALPNEAVGLATLDAWKAAAYCEGRDREGGAVLVATTDPAEREACRLESERRSVPIVDLEAQRVTIVRHVEATAAVDSASLTRDAAACVAMMDAPVLMLVDPWPISRERKKPAGKLRGRSHAAKLLQLGFVRMVSSRFIWAWNRELSESSMEDYSYGKLLSAKREGKLDKVLKSSLAEEVYGPLPAQLAERLGVPDPDDLMRE